MEMCWLNQTGAAEAIVVFGGWAVGPEVFAHLEGGQDVLFVSDYRDLSFDLPDLSGYDSTSLLAWSFGVASYAHWQQGRADGFTRKVAVNGTLTPVDRTCGIPPVAMQKTIETLSPEAYQLFVSRVFGARQPKAEIEVEARRQELLAVQARGRAPDPGFDRVLISEKDKIFPVANMRRAWEGCRTREISAAHMPFDRFSNWQEILG